MTERPSQHDDEPRLPEPLIKELRALHAARVFVPQETDAALLARARAELARRSRLARWRRISIGAAAAAAIAGAAVLTPYVRDFASSPSGETVTTGGADGSLAGHPAVSGVAGDIDGSGAVDILDALALARLLDARPPRPTLALADVDINGDGVIDRDDVEALAARVVALDREAG